MKPCVSSNPSSRDEQASLPALPLLISPLISSQLGLTFFRQPFALLAETNNFVRHVSTTVSSSVEGCLRMLELASRNGFLDKIMTSRLPIGFPTPPSSPRNVVMMRNLNFAAILPGDSVAGVVAANGILNFLNIYNTLLIVRLVLTWFPNAPPAVVSPLSTLCDPYLNIFRGIIPPLGGTLDLSPILAFLVLNAFTSTAAALPAELPPSLAPQNPSHLPHARATHLTSSHNKWLKRLSGRRCN